MRLIDADELMRSHCVECTYYNSGECLGANCDWDSIGHIREAKTVDAIPIEFIEKQAEYADSLMVALGIPASLVANEYRFLIKEWRKENETDKSSG